ncbi:alpha/beta hydrolase [Williamsia sp. CHRR-6]|uniref:alpha/beta hydrolase n=1 Tax=Williamsia sp. CHRR-6 TaxID=2835871 RepID=UPI001BDA13DA|nr:alpha/beta hydrolase [Williamsia sp. CHRR-6]
MDVRAFEPRWREDVLGNDFEAATIPLGADPDGEAAIEATLVRHRGAALDDTAPAALYVHGFTDYFFQRELAEAFAASGYRFHALDLRKCGRSLRPGHSPHFTTDLTQYDDELAIALDVIDATTPGAAVVVIGHSTGGLITSLWLDRIRRTDPARHGRVSGLVLNSPWLDLQGPPVLRARITTFGIHALARIPGLATATLPTKVPGGYGESLHVSAHGEWDYDLRLKPLGGFDVRFGFLSAVRRGHATLHQGIDTGVPTMVLRSDRSILGGPYRPEIDVVDTVLDTEQIARWSGALGSRVSTVAVTGARHDVFLSLPDVRAAAYEALQTWLRDHADTLTTRPAPPSSTHPSPATPGSPVIAANGQEATS